LILDSVFVHSFKSFFTGRLFAVAERVSNHKLLTLYGASLHVEWLKPGRPPPLYSDVDVSTDSLLFVDLPVDIDADQLRNYARKAASVTVHQIVFSPQPGAALVQYSGPIGLSVNLFVCVCLSFCPSLSVS